MGLFNKTPEEKFEKASLSSSGRKMLKLAEDGMQKAMTSIAYNYMNGFSLRKNLDKAKEWADKAADVKLYGVTQDTAEAYYTKGEVYLEFEGESYTKTAIESYKTAYEMLEAFNEHCFYSQQAGVALARLYMELNIDLDEAKEILINLMNKFKFCLDAKFELGRFCYYKENNLIPTLKYFDELYEEKYHDTDAILFEMDDIVPEVMKRLSEIKANEVSLKDIEEAKALKEYMIKYQWDDYMVEELSKIIAKLEK